MRLFQALLFAGFFSFFAWGTAEAQILDPSAFAGTWDATLGFDTSSGGTTLAITFDVDANGRVTNLTGGLVLGDAQPDANSSMLPTSTDGLGFTAAGNIFWTATGNDCQTMPP